MTPREQHMSSALRATLNSMRLVRTGAYEGLQQAFAKELIRTVPRELRPWMPLLNLSKNDLQRLPSL